MKRRGKPALSSEQIFFKHREEARISAKMNRQNNAAFTSSLVGASHFLSKRRIPNLCSRRPLYRPQTVRCAVLNPNEVLTETQLEEWSQVRSLLQSIDSALQGPDADKLVARAFGWGTQKFWRGDVKHEPPSMQQAEEAIEFLRTGIELDDASIAVILKSFPEVVRLSTTRMRHNVDQIQRNYPNIKGKLLVNTIKGTPAVLGFDYDCEGDCQSECARCWVQF